MPQRLFMQPLYLQLRDALAERIASGEWKPGDVIPNEVDLARELNVSPGTVRRSLDATLARCSAGQGAAWQR